jgi:Lipase (class 3)
MSSTTQQVMMTLAGLAATGATERPSGESLEQQEQRILNGINSQLANTSLAPAGQWSAIWVGLTKSRANLAYIAKNNTGVSPQYALCLRGTMAGSPIDTSEDMEVGLMLAFTAGGGGYISQGAMEAFTDIIMGTELMEILGIFAPKELFVTGHSLGGALVTTVSLYLAQNFLPAEDIYPYTFAAPTAGNQAFATLFDTQFPQAMCYYNYYDIVPYAWQNLAETYEVTSSLYPFYPNKKSKPPGPGPTAALDVDISGFIKGIAANTGPNNQYVQPAQQNALNNPNDGTSIFSEPYPAGATTDFQQFEVQVGYQHANTTYLTLLGLGDNPLPNVAPVVESVNPVSGPPGTAVTITPPDGCSFSQDSVVDFGIVPAASATVAEDGSTITAIAPAGVGTVDIRVTNIYGTSPVAPVYPNLTPYDYNDQFTFQPAG